jgi:3-hydroxyacyl-CoA dehydrogenase/enoyl-CoA hydratase/3-hydroxybutyryl-CoA epimerase
MFKGKYLTLDRDPQGAALLRMDPPGAGKPFALAQLWTEYAQALGKIDQFNALGHGRIPLLLIQGSKRGFLAGWAPDWLEANLGSTEYTEAHERFRECLVHLRNLTCPVIAVIHGPCLGEGLELALAADYRIALDQPRLQFGFLTDERGLIPEGGMIGRLMGLVGWEKASLLAAGGPWIGGPAAKTWGLLDGLALDEASLKGLIVLTMGKALAQGKTQGETKTPKLPLRTWRQRIWESTGMGRAMLARGMDRLVALRTKEDARAATLAVTLAKTLPWASGEAQSAARANLELAKSTATKFLVGFQAEFQRWKESGTIKPPANPASISLQGNGNAGIWLLSLHARKGGIGFIQEKDPDTLGKITLGLKKSFPKRSSLARLAMIEADPDGTKSAKATLTVLDALEPPAGATSRGERLCLNLPRQSGMASPGQRAGIVVLPDRPFLVLLESPEGRDFSQGPSWLAGLGSVVRNIKPGCELLAPMILWVIWDEIIHLANLGLILKAIEADWFKMGMRPGPLQLLDLQGLPLAARMELAWKARQPSQVEQPWAEAVLEAGFPGWPERRGIGMTMLGRWVPNPLALNAINKQWSSLGEKERPDPLWQALGSSARVRQGRERVLMRLASVAAQFQIDSGLDETTIDRLLVVGIGWPAHKPGPLAWARMTGWKTVVENLEKLTASTGANRYRPSEAALVQSRESSNPANQ